MWWGTHAARFGAAGGDCGTHAHTPLLCGRRRLGPCWASLPGRQGGSCGASPSHSTLFGAAGGDCGHVRRRLRHRRGPHKAVPGRPPPSPSCPVTLSRCRERGPHKAVPGRPPPVSLSPPLCLSPSFSRFLSSFLFSRCMRACECACLRERACAFGGEKERERERAREVESEKLPCARQPRAPFSHGGVGLTGSRSRPPASCARPAGPPRMDRRGRPCAPARAPGLPHRWMLTWSIL